MSAIQLAATARTEFGKGAARRVRRANQIPAVLYGHGADPQHIALPGHATMMALKHSNVLLEIQLENGSQLAIARDVQRDPVKDVIEHVDLLAVRRGEKIAVEVPVHVVGESVPGTIHMVETQTLSIEADATALPENVEISIDGMEAGSLVRAGEVALPSGATLLTDPDEVVLSVTLPQAEEEPAEEAAEGAAEPAAEEEPAEEA